MHSGALVTSTNRTGSQKLIGIPGIGTGFPRLLQKHTGILAEELEAGIDEETTLSPAT
jgi:hypothetical protein